MITVALLGADAARLEALLQPHLPADVRVIAATSGEDLGAEGLAAEVALGPPDALAPLVGSMARLKWVQSTWAGVKPLLQGPRPAYQLTGVKDLFGGAMSEYVLGWVLALRRSVLIHARASTWSFVHDAGLGDCRLGIAGTGSIGREVARRCAPFFAEVRGLNSDGRALPEFTRCYPTAEREAFAADLDVLALVLPDTRGTDRLFAARELARLQEGAIVLNGGRANTLDLPAALEALDVGQVSALVLDVFDREPVDDASPLWSTPGVYITSHTAAPTDKGAIARLFLINLERYRTGQPLQGLIDVDKGY